MTAPQQPQERRARRFDEAELLMEVEPVQYSPRCRRCQERLVGQRARAIGTCDDCVGRGGNPVSWLGLILAAIALGGIVALLMLAFAAPPRAAPVPTAPQPTLDAVGLVQAATSAPAGASGPALPGAEPTTEVGTTVDVARGWAAWYPGSRGWHSIAHVALPDSRYRTPRQGPSQWVTVTVFVGDSVRTGVFPAVDDCACGDRRGDPTVVDLSHGALRELGLWDIRFRDGIWRAEVQYGADPPPDRPAMTLPATDQEERP